MLSLNSFLILTVWSKCSGCNLNSRKLVGCFFGAQALCDVWGCNLNSEIAVRAVSSFFHSNVQKVNTWLQINTVGRNVSPMYVLRIFCQFSSMEVLQPRCLEELPEMHSSQLSWVLWHSHLFQLFICNTSWIFFLFIAASSPRGQIAGTLGILGVNLQSFLILFRQFDRCNQWGSQHLSIFVRQSMAKHGQSKIFGFLIPPTRLIIGILSALDISRHPEYEGERAASAWTIRPTGPPALLEF